MSPTLSDARPALQAAVVDVAENSLFAFCDVLDREGFVTASAAAGSDWICAKVSFRGPHAGQVSVVLPAGLARDLGAALLGEMPEALTPPAVSDFAGEFANMACGAWLTAAFPKDAFDLTPPAVEAGLAGVTVVDGAADDADVYLALNDAPVLVRLSGERTGARA